jgi:hypothetical protein
MLRYRRRSDGWNFALSVFHYPVFYIVCNNRLYYFRLFGYGLTFKDVRYHPPLFSERYGYTKRLKLGSWRVGVLRPTKGWR